MKIRKQKRMTAFSFIAIYMVCLMLILLRWANIFNEDILVMNKEINSHITNFTLSILINIFIGYLFLIYRKNFKYIILTSLFISLVNYGYEMFLSFINTKDIIDGHYGLIGVIISLGYLYLINKYGFIDEQ